MVVRGHVKNGVIVLDESVTLAEGEEVSVVVERLQRGKGPHSVLDIPPVSVGEVLRPLSSDDDLLGEMLEGRRL